MNLESLISTPSKAESAEARFFRKYGLTENPFPPQRTILPEILYNQESAFKDFGLAASAVMKDTLTRRSLAVVAGTGTGKTHFLRFCAREFSQYCEKHDKIFPVVEFQAGSGKVDELWREVLNACDVACRARHEIDLITAIMRKVERPTGRRQLDSVKSRDLRVALDSIAEPSVSNNYDSLRETLQRWLRGVALNQAEKKRIGVTSRIATVAAMTKVMRDLLALAQRLQIIDGVFLCIDEIEALFSTGLRPAQYQSFLQELRFLFDASVDRDYGYSLLILATATTTWTQQLLQINYPLYQRLGFEENARKQLLPISSADEAEAFAEIYIRFNKSKFAKLHLAEQGVRGILSADEIAATYQRLPKIAPRSVTQAELLNALHNAVGKKFDTYQASRT